MKRQHERAWFLVLFLAAAVATTIGCAKQPEVGSTAPGGPSMVSAPPTPPPGQRPTETQVTPPPAPRETTTTAPVQTAASPLKDVFFEYDKALLDRKSTRLNSSHIQKSRMPSSA